TCKGTQFPLVRRTIQQRDELRMQSGMNLPHDFARRFFETSYLLQIEDHLLKHPLRIIAVTEKAAINAIEPLLPFPIENRCRRSEDGIGEASRSHDSDERFFSMNEDI